ncbi:MAG: hypothetical protein R2865_12300 [Deinococcales bacterium]
MVPRYEGGIYTSGPTPIKQPGYANFDYCKGYYETRQSTPPSMLGHEVVLLVQS